MNVNNSTIYDIAWKAASAENTVFNNCNIGGFAYNVENAGLATYRNCIIGGAFSEGDPTTTFINCLLASWDCINGKESHNCYIGTKDGILFDWNYDCIWSTVELTEKGYLGTDGKVVGIFGGESPFTMIPSSPKITDYSSSVDPTTRKITVNLKVTNQ